MRQLLPLIVFSIFASNAAQSSNTCHRGSYNFPQSHNRIVGGSNARLGQFPWQAVVYPIKTNGNENKLDF